MDGLREGAGRGGDVFGQTPPAHLTHIVAEISFPSGNHLTLIKGGRGTVERKRMAVFPPWERSS